MEQIYGYCRVSTGVQTTENQRKEILDYAHTKSMVIDKIVEIEVSSTKSKKDRLIDKTLDELQRKDILIVTKLDRLGRSTIEVLQIIEDIKDKGILLHVIKDGIVIDGNDTSPINQMIITLLTGFAQMERSFISERTKSALAQRKASGVKLGRQKGAIVKSKYDEHLQTIKELVNKDVSIASISKIIAIGTRQSLTTYIKTRKIKQDTEV